MGSFSCPTPPLDSTATSVTVEALRASDGSPFWSRTFPTDAPGLFQLTVVNRVVYVRSAVESIDAFRTSDGTLLWHYTSHSSFVSLPSVADGMVYAERWMVISLRCEPVTVSPSGMSHSVLPTYSLPRS